MSTLSLKEKIGYALGDGAANIAWRGVSTFLFIFYTDVFGLHPAAVGLLFLIARFGDGISDVIMGIICDRTNTKYGKFRPWILWSAIPLGVILSLLFMSPELSENGKLIYAYIAYISFTLIYTANNIPYGALMSVMTGDDKERTSLGSFRMAGAFIGGMIVQGALLYLVSYYGNINPTVKVENIGDHINAVTVSAKYDVKNVNITTKDGLATFQWDGKNLTNDTTTTKGKSFSVQANENYRFLVHGASVHKPEDITIVDQKKGYSRAIYLLSIFLSIFMIITFLSTKERVQPPKDQKTDVKRDFVDLVKNKPWIVLLIVGLLFNVFNAIKQGIVVIYFSHFVHDPLMTSSYLVALAFASIVGAIITAPLGKRFGKRNLFIFALLFAGITNALFMFCNPSDIALIFGIGILTEIGAAIFPTLFFAMLGDAADYSEYKNGRRATGLIYSAGSFATKFGGGLAGAIIGFVLSYFHYDGQNDIAIQGALPGIVMLMGWIPSVVAVITAGFMMMYPLTQSKMETITTELQKRRNM